ICFLKKIALGTTSRWTNGLVRKTRLGSSRNFSARSPSGSSDRAAAINTPESKNVRIIRRSEVSAPAIRYLALEFPAGEHLLARCLDLLPDPAAIPAEFRHRSEER